MVVSVKIETRLLSKIRSGHALGDPERHGPDTEARFPRIKNMPAKKKHGGQNKYKPSEADRNTVKSMAATGFAHEIIAKCLGKEGIDDKTMRKHFRRELDTAAAMANAVVGNALYQAAQAGQGWAVCFWLKCRARWKEVHTHEISGPDGGPIDVNATVRDEFTSRIASVAARIRALEADRNPK